MFHRAQCRNSVCWEYLLTGIRFLLSYSSRDSVEILAQGVRGAHEMRDAALSYYNSPDAKPLFGLIQFRRRKVLIKLVMEGTSRLITGKSQLLSRNCNSTNRPSLARVQVHWGSVTSRFGHDETYEPTKCEQLDDNSLTQHIELHSSRSSSGSNKKTTLDGIEETSEERMSLERAKEKAAAIKAEAEKMAEATPPIPEIEKTPALKPSELKLEERKATETSSVAPPKSPDEWPMIKPDYALSINAFSIPDDDSLSDEDLAPRMSSQTARPSTSDRYASSLYESIYKSKAKIGPRPSMDSRPGTSKSARGVATLPVGMKANRPPSTIQLRPKSRDSHMVSIPMPPPPPIPETPTMLEIPRPRSSAGSVKSLPAMLPKSPGMTPEKARLKKYQEMYKRKEKERARQSAIPAVPALPAMPQIISREERRPTTPKATPTTTSPVEPEAAPSPVDNAKSDSGVGMDDSPTEEATKAEPGVEKIPEEPASANVEPDDHLKPPDPGPVEQPQQTPSTEEPSSMHSLSSPTSLQDSSGRTSTRPTSVSEESLEDKATPATEPAEEEQIDTPSTIVQEKTPTELTPSETVAAASSALAADLELTPPSERSHISLVQPFDASSPWDEDKQMKTDETSNSAISRRSSVDSHKAKRRGIVPPLHISATNSEVDYDEDFMDELHDAEVVEAKSLSVSKSPITPFFPRRPSTHISLDQRSTNSAEPTPTTNGKSPSPLPSPDSSFARTPSGSRLSSLPQQQGDGVVVAKPMKIQTGIASKIADLQRSFSRGSGVSTTPPPSNKTPEGVKHSISQRGFPFTKATPSRTPSSQWGNRPGSKASFSSAETESPVSRPRAASNLSSRISLYNNPPQENPKKEIMEVRATIVRTDRTSKVPLLPPTADTPLELHESPLVINHQRAKSAAPQEAPKHPKRQSSLTVSSAPFNKSDSLASPGTPLSPISDKADKESITGSTRRSMEGAWRSLGRRMSRSESKKNHSQNNDSSQPTSPTFNLPQSMSNSSLETADSRSDSQSQKKGSRASRLIRRMSTSMSSIASVGKLPLPLSPRGAAKDLSFPDPETTPSIAEVNEPAPRPPAIDIGDLNVQFPDTLLWKRRWVEIDAHGFVVLRPLEMQGSSGRAGLVKKYHLSEFREPFVPDMERQEMPWSVVCDFRDGRCLQFGTGSGGGQVGLVRCK